MDPESWNVIKCILYGKETGGHEDQLFIFVVFKMCIMCISTDYFCVFLGLDAELYYVRDDVVNHYALSFILPVPSETNSMHFTWHSKSKVHPVHQNFSSQICPVTI